MAKLVYTALMSLDGYVADKAGSFDWAMPNEEVHAFVNDLERANGTLLYGRRMYEVMTFWEDAAALKDEPKVVQEYGEIWRAAEKMVYSRSLHATSTARTRLASKFDAQEVRELKSHAQRDLAIAGAELAGVAFHAGLVDEVGVVIAPVVVGGGKAALPSDIRLILDLQDRRIFANGMVHLHYQVRSLS
jgi:dihydrofolate reductase